MTQQDERLALAQRLNDDILAPLKQTFVGKDEIIDLLGVCLVARENLFLLGPPGTAKSAIVQELGRRIDGRVFDYLLTRFTEPNELFGPFDIRKLREGELVTNTEGMLPEASFVFLDELLNANSAILNSLLLALNERIFRRGRETRKLETLMVVGASNSLPQDDALGALFDRFLMRVRCDNVESDQLPAVLAAGWKLDAIDRESVAKISVDDVRQLHELVRDADFSEVATDFVDLIIRLRNAGITVSDRRAVKLQRVLAASALLCGRLKVIKSDMWPLRYIWDSEEQQEVLASIVNEVLSVATDDENVCVHPRSQTHDAPDADELAKQLDQIAERLDDTDVPLAERAVLQDRVGVLASRCQWVKGEQPRQFLEEKVSALMERF